MNERKPYHIAVVLGFCNTSGLQDFGLAPSVTSFLICAPSLSQGLVN